MRRFYVPLLAFGAGVGLTYWLTRPPKEVHPTQPPGAISFEGELGKAGYSCYLIQDPDQRETESLRAEIEAERKKHPSKSYDRALDILKRTQDVELSAYRSKNREYCSALVALLRDHVSEVIPKIDSNADKVVTMNEVNVALEAYVASEVDKLSSDKGQ